MPNSITVILNSFADFPINIIPIDKNTEHNEFNNEVIILIDEHLFQDRPQIL